MTVKLDKNIIFCAEAAKGHIIKIIVDTLCGGGISRGVFVIDKSGLILRQQDQGSTILYDIDLPCSQLRNYRCTKPMAISINLKHMQGLLKTIKKKDCLTMHIDSQKPEKLYITIKPEGTRDMARFEARGIAYQVEEGYTLTPLPDGGYQYPMVISSSDFQKVKQITSISKKINIEIQKSNYLSFTCDAGAVMDAKLCFGNKIDDDTMEKDEDTSETCAECGEEYNECWCECGVCNEYISECWCECNVCGEYKTWCSCAKKGVFCAEYHSSILNKLVKLPGLCSQMQFYAPSVEQYPLRIAVNAGQGGYTFGKIQVFIKDVKQIDYEATLQNNNDDIVQVTRTKGKGKKK